MPELLQNWLPRTDLTNFFEISGFEVIRTHERLLVPVGIPVISWIANRVVAHVWPFGRLCLSRFLIARVPQPPAAGRVTCSVVITCRDERDNIEPLIQRTAILGGDTQIIFSEGHSTDGTREEIQRCMAAYPHRNIQLVIQDGIGQGDAMRKGFKHATGDLILWLEADLTTPPEEILKLYGVLAEGKGEFVNGSRLVYPMPGGSMRLLNLWGNRFFGRLFTWLLGQPFRDTLCGLKGLTRIGYMKIVAEKGYFGDFDPFGDFEILFGASKRNLKIVEVPVHYRPRVYGTTKISRFRDGWLLLRMSWLALWRLKLY
jgi:glycosyltransferase involved in cell wall biosynthesis